MFYLGLIESGFIRDDVAKRVLTNVFGLHVLPFLGFDKFCRRDTSMRTFRRRSFNQFSRFVVQAETQPDVA